MSVQRKPEKNIAFWHPKSIPGAPGQPHRASQDAPNRARGVDCVRQGTQSHARWPIKANRAAWADHMARRRLLVSVSREYRYGYTCIYVCMLCMYIRMHYVCMRVCMYVLCMYVCMNVRTYVHTYVCTYRPASFCRSCFLSFLYFPFLSSSLLRWRLCLSNAPLLRHQIQLTPQKKNKYKNKN